MDITQNALSVLSVCPGILGLERGFERAVGSIRTVAYVEIEAFIIENLLAGMEAGILAPTPIWSNLKTFDPRPFHKKVHFILGGYPCQPFSKAGQRKGAADPRHLWPYLESTVDIIKPVGCFFENVAAHLTFGFDQVYKSLRDMGYSVEAGIYTAQEVGAPHERERLFILALANSISQGLEERRKKLSNPLCYDGNEIQIKKGKSIRRCQFKFDGNTGRIDRFPAGRGYYQHEWEEPRTIKSRMGSSINGYNFREDLLRAFGNSVVEQTAELAFIDLLSKHCNK